MGKLTYQGYSTNTLETWKTKIQQVFVDAFGNDFIIADDTPQGVFINRLAELFYNCDMDGLNAFLQLNVNTATGVLLDYIAFLRGTKRKLGTNQQLTCSFTATTTPVYLAANTKFTVLDTDYQYENTSATTIAVSPQSITLRAVESGNQEVSVGDYLQSDIYIPSITNIQVTAVVKGKDTETDEELRKRLLLMTDDFLDTLGSTLSALLRLDGVIKIGFLQKEDDSTVPTNSTEFLVVGGDEQDIAKTILEYKCPTSLTFGSTTVVVDNYYGRTRTIYFSRPTQKQVEVKAVITKKEGQTTINVNNNSTIKQEVCDYVNGQDIGIDVSYTTIYGIFAKYNDFDIVSLEIGLVGGDSASTNITLGNREYATCEPSAITITVQN